jgi:hypothetical protein
MPEHVLPPLGSADRHKIESIRDKLFDRGYDLQIGYVGTWSAALHRHGLKGTSSTPWESGETPREAVEKLWRRYEHSPHLTAIEPDPAELAKRRDRYYFHRTGTLIIRQGFQDLPWLVTWLPNEGDPAYPGFTLSSSERDIPTDQGVAGVLLWVVEQDWGKPLRNE